jgi:hypothetical protein
MSASEVAANTFPGTWAQTLEKGEVLLCNRQDLHRDPFFNWEVTVEPTVITALLAKGIEWPLPSASPSETLLPNMDRVGVRTLRTRF